MSLLKSVAVPLAAVGAICGVLAATAPAEAQEYRSGLIGGFQSEILDSGSFTEEDFIVVQGPKGEEQILVTCSPFDWSSRGPNSRAFVEHITSEWCF